MNRNIFGTMSVIIVEIEDIETEDRVENLEYKSMRKKRKSQEVIGESKIKGKKRRENKIKKSTEILKIKLEHKMQGRKL